MDCRWILVTSLGLMIKAILNRRFFYMWFWHSSREAGVFLSPPWLKPVIERNWWGSLSWKIRLFTCTRGRSWCCSALFCRTCGAAPLALMDSAVVCPSQMGTVVIIISWCGFTVSAVNSRTVFIPLEFGTRCLGVVLVLSLCLSVKTTALLPHGLAEGNKNLNNIVVYISLLLLFFMSYSMKLA